MGATPSRAANSSPHYWESPLVEHLKVTHSYVILPKGSTAVQNTLMGAYPSGVSYGTPTVSWLPSQILGYPEKTLATSQHSSLFCCSISDKEKKGFNLRSLETNFFLFASLASILCIYFIDISYTNKALTLSVYKAITPVLTTIANFGKIQNVLLMYFQNFKSKIRSCKLTKNWLL